MPGFALDPACPIEWSHPLNRGLVADYTIIPGETGRSGIKLRNLARRNNYGTLDNGPTWTKGAVTGVLYDSLLYVRASSTRVNCGSSPILQPIATGTIFARINCNTYGNFNTGVYNMIATSSTFSTDRNGVGFWLSGNGVGTANFLMSEVCSASAATVTGGATVVSTKDAWEAVAMTWDGTNIIEYNLTLGTSATTSQGGVTPVSGTNPFSIGNTYNGDYTDADFGGGINTVLVFNQAKTLAQLNSLEVETRRGNPQRFRWRSRKKFFVAEPPAPPAGNRRRRLLLGAAA